jgi:hypothetical protein
MARLENLRGYRYGEILLLKQDERGFFAEVWNTMGFNDCPPPEIDAIDLEAEAAARGALFAMKNGPRFWTFDALEASMRETAEVTTFGTLGMFLAATVTFGDTPPARMDYVERWVERDNWWEFAAHQPRYYLTAANGDRYIMQAFAHYVDATQTMDTLRDLGSVLQLPEGWTFTFDLDPATTLRIGTPEDNQACVLQDEKANTYQKILVTEEF